MPKQHTTFCYAQMKLQYYESACGQPRSTPRKKEFHAPLDMGPQQGGEQQKKKAEYSLDMRDTKGGF
jgi:hypothetical protein